MKNKIKILLCVFCFWSTNMQFIIARTVSTEIKKSKRNNSRKAVERTIRFHFQNEDLIDVINYMASQRNVNIMLPQGANAITNKVTMDIEELLSVEEAWNILNTILDIAGYTMFPKENMYEVVRTTPNITREPLPLFVGMSPDKLPNIDERIRYIYYFTNIKANDAPDSELVVILQNLLPYGTTSYKVDTNSNAVIITAKSDDIRSVMKIVTALDKVDFHETMEFIKLRFTTAKFVADLFNENILKAANDMNRYRLDARQQTEATFFSKYVKIFSEDRTNSLIVLGRPQAIERIRDFIYKYLDVELDSAQSILHVYELQYLDAEKMEAVLNRIVQSAQTGGTEQSRVSGGATLGGTERTFDEVIIKADKPTSADRKYYGGNKLVVAARNEDWKIIEKLIQELDIPQPQVLIEVLVADLTLEDTRILGSLLRNPAKIPLMGQTNIQSAQIGEIIPNLTSLTPPNADTLQSDLLSLYFNPDGTTGTQNSIAQVISNANPGSTFISISDNNGSTWNLLQILQSFNNSKILSHPHVITANNQKATLRIGEMRLLQDEAVGSGGTTTTVKFKQEEADLTVLITPRISAANTVQLDVSVDVIDWTSLVANSRINRHVETVATVADKDILALGGLIKVNSNEQLNETPILGQIPIIGYFFKKRSADITKSNLTVFISPTIIEPRLRSGVDQYTKEYVSLTKSYAREFTLFDSLKDLITRWFFNTNSNDADEILDEFLAKDEFKSFKKREEIITDVETVKTPKRSRKSRKRRTNDKAVACPEPCAPKASAVATTVGSEKTEALQRLIEKDAIAPAGIHDANKPELLMPEESEDQEEAVETQEKESVVDAKNVQEKTEINQTVVQKTQEEKQIALQKIIQQDDKSLIQKEIKQEPAM